ncbi:family 78 glycoside hydrolase catalytic domain [Sphingobium yanoikuyae]|uniref:Family 78 glycoside hydrolase catalytic domain n=1 Tax=Sphingobium yanoikuyae TaxID=13690 RepID=A0AA42WSF0_SPHYA|nr:family 78 glycoside hydrolase catalytic domain [Sphingobium yanoikuyae]MDH2130955.1 family 78 glycoside hydrolase catalytic domain [Sphingobium yanoikuyae]MDH2149137.1 family 78 glycoside hydrolase catalytic domain [Sphingobium yanoikuyae]MDH2164876.1 family 78 glycoside hydrolase catalytic domain [Sphingobium yanoikuyae]
MILRRTSAAIEPHRPGQCLGQQISLRFAELLNPDGTADQSNLRRTACTDHVILRGDPAGEHFEPSFTYHGFRYVEVEGYPGRPTLDDIAAVVVPSNCRETGEIQLASPRSSRSRTMPCGASAPISSPCRPTVRSATSAWDG